jgi:hypothetical protein
MPLPLDPDLSPRSAAEELGYTFLPCVLVGLSRAPQFVLKNLGTGEEDVGDAGTRGRGEFFNKPEHGFFPISRQYTKCYVLTWRHLGFRSRCRRCSCNSLWW